MLLKQVREYFSGSIISIIVVNRIEEKAFLLFLWLLCLLQFCCFIKLLRVGSMCAYHLLIIWNWGQLFILLLQELLEFKRTLVVWLQHLKRRLWSLHMILSSILNLNKKLPFLRFIRLYRQRLLAKTLSSFDANVIQGVAVLSL